MAFGYYGNQYYPQQYYPQMMQAAPQAAQITPQSPQQNADDRIWVQGENAATAYLVAPNSFVRLWDSTMPVFYEKRADAQGKPLPMEVYDYTRRGGEPAKQESTELERRFAQLEERITALEKVKVDE